MSRTAHRRRGEPSQHRQANSTRLTKVGPNSWYFPHVMLLEASGNQWAGTISSVGGDQRRRLQIEQRDDKVRGKREQRRAARLDLKRADHEVP